MAKINLLPWRAELRRERQRQFISLTVLSCILTLMVMGVVHLMYAGQITEQEARNAYLQSEIVVVDAQIEEIRALEKQREDLEQRMNIIHELQQSRPLNVHLFDEIPRVMPEGVYLTELVRKGQNIEIRGKTESSPRVATFMRNFESSQWFATPDLNVIEADKRSSMPSSDFSLKVQQTGVLAPGDENAKKKGAKK